jgi:hypothetical protein
MAKKTRGKTASGVPSTDRLAAELARKAKVGCDVEETIRRRVGRPPIGSAAASVESVRLEPQKVLAERARHDQETTTSVIRKAPPQYLRPS